MLCDELFLFNFFPSHTLSLPFSLSSLSTLFSPLSPPPPSPLPLLSFIYFLKTLSTPIGFWAPIFQTLSRANLTLCIIPPAKLQPSCAPRISRGLPLNSCCYTLSLCLLASITFTPCSACTASLYSLVLSSSALCLLLDPNLLITFSRGGGVDPYPIQ